MVRTAEEQSRWVSSGVGNGADGGGSADRLSIPRTKTFSIGALYRLLRLFAAGIRRGGLSLPAIVLIGSALRLINLGSEHLWFDEAFTWLNIQPTSDLWSGIIGDAHPPLWTVIQAALGRVLGYSEFGLRLTPAALGIASIVMIYHVARCMMDRRGARAAAGIAAIMPGLIYFSQDGRMYGLLLLLILICLWGALKRYYIIYMVAGAAAAYTHNIGLVYAGLIGLAMLSARPHPKGLIAVAGMGIMWLPWLPIFIQQAGYVSGGYWTPPMSLGSALQPFVWTTLGSRLTEMIQVPTIAGAGGLTMLSLIVGRAWLYKRTNRPYWAVLLGAPAVLALYSILISPAYVFRALLPSGALIAILWGYTLTHLSPANLKYAQSVFVLAISLSLGGYYLTLPRPDINEMIAPIRAHWQHGDLIYFADPTIAIAWTPYLDLPYEVFPLPDTIMNVTRECRRAFGLIERAWSEVTAQRVWVVAGIFPFTEDVEWQFLRQVGTMPGTDWYVPEWSPREQSELLGLSEGYMFRQYVFLVNR